MTCYHKIRYLFVERGFIMPDKDDLEHLLDQINDLVRMAQEKQPEELEGEVPPLLEEKLNKLELQVEKFQEMNQQYIASKKLSDLHLQDIKEELHKLHPRDRWLIEYAGRLTSQIKEARNNLEAAIEETRKTRDIEARKPKEGSRRSKFKRVGGQKNWKPL